MTQQIEKVWPDWKVVEEIGGGSYGTVYKAVRQDHNLTSYAAIKVISIPKSTSEIDSLRSDGMTIDGTRTFLQGIVNDFVGEIEVMESLKGTQNIVSVEDYKVIERTGEIGWDIYIRMELLTPFTTWRLSHPMTEADAIRIGVDLCSALEICEKKQIIHRDIKPENIFVNEFGFFKLGDFGIARKLSAAQSSNSIKGTYNYMAPEVSRGTDYDSRVDIYSLGIVLYRLMNDYYLPFIENAEQDNNAEARNNALNRRLRGEQLPPPRNASRDLANLILCACAYEPDKRFRSASVMKRALQNLLGTQPASDGMTARIVPGPSPVQPPRPAGPKATPKKEAAPEKTPEPQEKPKEKKKKEKKEKKKGGKKWLIILLLVLILLGAAAVFVLPAVMPDKGESLPLIGGAISEANAESAKKQEIETILADAATYADAGDYANALKTLNAGLMKYPDDAELTAKQTEYTTQQAAQDKQAALDQAAEYASAKDYKSALKTIQLAQTKMGNDADFLQKIAEYTDSYKKAVTETASGYESSGDYLNAYKAIKEALDLVGDDASLNVKLSLYEQSYVSSVTAQADEKIAAKDFTGARTLLNSALKELPGNTELTDKLNQVSSSQPVSLSTLSVLNGGWDWNDTAPEDPFGNDYSNAVNYAVFGERRWDAEYVYESEYRVYGNYSSISFSLVPYKDTATEGTGYVQIYADDVLVQTSPVVGQKTDQISVTANIAGAEYLKVVVHTAHCGMVILSDVQLWP